MDPARELHNAQGQRLLLGRELGRGGEGVVHELPSHPDWVAKRYHQPPDAAKQQKLRLMAESIDSPLREYAAWPEATLHDATGGVIGFTMQRIEGRLPIHMLYSPAQRRESFAQARFDFLVFVARNIAAAFATLHEHGHVLGDVNQGNVLVGADSRVILIDCDSFQIQVGDALHRCEVGVAHFTPPELQRVASFEDITRTPNHDAFGLALLIFHLLMGGRHPYSGVPLADHIGESLEADIRDFRYAYAKDAAQRLIAPPPKSVPIDSLPPAIVALFEQAFTEPGVDARPTPQQWVGALDALRAQLQACAKNPLHVHAGVTGECVWCGLDRRHLVFFGEPARPLPKVVAKPELDLDAMEAEVNRLGLPEPFELPRLAPLPDPDRETDTPLPRPIVTAGLGLSALGVAGFLVLHEPAALMLTVFGLVIANGLKFVQQQDTAVVDYRYALGRYRKAEERLRQRLASLNAGQGGALLQRWRSSLAELRNHLADDARLEELADHQRLRAFLYAQRIRDWKHEGLTAIQRLVLEAHGIETAADCDRDTLRQTNFLAPELRAALLQWRDDLIARYRQRSVGGTAVVSIEERHRRRARRRLLEAELANAFAAVKQSPRSQVAVSAERIRELQALKSELARAHSRCIEYAKDLS